MWQVLKFIEEYSNLKSMGFAPDVITGSMIAYPNDITEATEACIGASTWQLQTALRPSKCIKIECCCEANISGTRLNTSFLVIHWVTSHPITRSVVQTLYSSDYCQFRRKPTFGQTKGSLFRTDSYVPVILYHAWPRAWHARQSSSQTYTFCYIFRQLQALILSGTWIS